MFIECLPCARHLISLMIFCYELSNWVEMIDPRGFKVFSQLKLLEVVIFYSH